MYTGTLAILSTCPLTSPKVSDRPVEMSLSGCGQYEDDQHRYLSILLPPSQTSTVY